MCIAFPFFFSFFFFISRKYEFVSICVLFIAKIYFFITFPPFFFFCLLVLSTALYITIIQFLFFYRNVADEKLKKKKLIILIIISCIASYQAVCFYLGTLTYDKKQDTNKTSSYLPSCFFFFHSLFLLSLSLLKADKKKEIKVSRT